MFRATHTPPLSIILDDLLTSDRATIARHLGISLRTLERYIAAGEAPRAVTLALFWETRWGWSIADTGAFNDARFQAQRAAGLERENETLRTRIARLEGLGGFGSANEPMYAAR
jgi:hypothetical protein